MLEPDYLRARRAAARARLRRQRIAAGVVALVVVAAGAAGALAVANGGARRRRRPTAPAVIARLPRVHVTPIPAGSLSARGVARIRALARLGLPVYCAGPRGNEVAFTFDDGPGPYTHLALRKLAQAHEGATFFVVGRSMRAWPGWVQREARQAAIGDHTYTHPFLPELSAPEIAYQLGETKAMIEQRTHEGVYLFRPPYGSRTPVIDRIARELGLLEILWSVDSADSLGANWRGIIRNVEAGLRPGAIILMHENHGQTIRALTTLLPVLRQRHLRSVSLPVLFATDPPTVAQLHRGEAACGLHAPVITGS